MAHEVDYDRRLIAARRAVADACLVVNSLTRSGRPLAPITKDDRSPVTIADWAAQAVVARRLREMLPPAPIVAEESAAALRAPERAPDREILVEAVRTVWPAATESEVLDAIDLGRAENTGEGGVFWTLDPIDGTKGLLRGGQFCVSLAWIEAGEPTLGVLGCPSLSADFTRPFDSPDPHGVIYFAYSGTGLYEVAADRAMDEALHIRRLPRASAQPVRVCESFESSHASHADAARVMTAVGPNTSTDRLDSQCKYAVVARGQADAFLRVPSRRGYIERIWDHAAGVVIAREAGCAVTDARGKLLDFSLGRGLEANRGIVCAPPEIHGRILGAIRSLGLDQAP